eukprot:CAMPEP_0170516042 /NCGR_PEP_ID=MMETSP0209-20121228/2387_1 /TAXON_ID=665100 ORGANISM="Litonotus pictus, Strain P1" /NCGR_SAMPLE_ID=MMETSP0209 /ASSEMBLY_ACC=CAM_ASM_000301 /LENGTH=532 /DNA_ID=CAMNT_0010800807 /DNA_START=59 /DNA_END=1657 /DNA_ORIENTATION=+
MNCSEEKEERIKKDGQWTSYSLKKEDSIFCIERNEKEVYTEKLGTSSIVYSVEFFFDSEGNCCSFKENQEMSHESHTDNNYEIEGIKMVSNIEKVEKNAVVSKERPSENRTYRWNLDLLKSKLSKKKGDYHFFTKVPQAPAGAIFGITLRYRADEDPRKVDLGIGVYKTEEGHHYVFEVVKEAEKRIYNDLLEGEKKAYQNPEGNLELLDLSQKLVFGDNYTEIKNRLASSQSVGGTGAVKIAADFLKVFNPTTVYIPKETWSNHLVVFERAGLKVAEYSYFDYHTKGLDFTCLLDQIEQAPDKSVFLFHACAQNPTGVDPTHDQWKQIAAVMKRKNHFPIFDNAYQGLATGDIDRDAFSIRYFVEQGFELMVTQSYSKIMGLYGERIGVFHALLDSEKTAQNVKSQLRVVVRVNYSNPPLHPMRIALKVLSDPILYSRWLIELYEMSGRVQLMRKLLREELERINTPGDWSIITSQIGMFSFTGLTPDQCERMMNENHIYMLTNGRISMAGLNNKNVRFVAEGMKKSIENK